VSPDVPAPGVRMVQAGLCLQVVYVTQVFQRVRKGGVVLWRGMR